MTIKEHQYDFLSSQVGRIAQSTADGFRLFVQTFSAILGGTIWLRLQMNGHKISPKYELLSNAIVVILTIVCMVMVVENVRSWWRYRKGLEHLTADTDFPAPAPEIRNVVMEGIMVLAMLVGCALFVCYNPFTL